jgi:hypothetical protein
MLARAADLRQQYTHRPSGAPTGLVHRDPWSGNVVRTASGPVLEREFGGYLSLLR